MQGCYDIGLPSGKSLFQLHAERILKVQQLAVQHCNMMSEDHAADQARHGDNAAAQATGAVAAQILQSKVAAGTQQRVSGVCARVQWYIMTSPATHRATKAFFEQHGFFGLDAAQVLFFQQGTLPCLTAQGHPIMGRDGQVRGSGCCSAMW